MTLEESKDILEYSDKDYFMETLYETYHYSNVKKFEKAIDTVLKALEEYEKQLDLDYVRDNYIPKEKVRKKIAEIIENDNLVINEGWDSADVICAKREEMAQVDILKELLGE